MSLPARPARRIGEGTEGGTDLPRLQTRIRLSSLASSQVDGVQRLSWLLGLGPTAGGHRVGAESVG